ncbi:MAG: hypothetical protein ACYTFY_07865 [Planctomycetota bacterium]
MNTALVISIILNIFFIIIILAYYIPRINRSKKLPEAKPDFVAIKTALEKELEKPGNKELFELMSFETKTWLCRASIKENFDNPSKENWEKLQEIVGEVKSECKIPGRQGGWVQSPENPRLNIGTTIEFGYSSEVGYNHKNEFINR